MQNIFINYPEVPWKSGWKFSSGPENQLPFITADPACLLTVPDSDWMLQLLEPESLCTTRIFYNGFSIGARKRADKSRIDAIVTGPGLLCGAVSGLPMPRLLSTVEIKKDAGYELLHSGKCTVFLLRQESRFVLVCGELTATQARAKAEAALDENFEKLIQTETDERKNVSRLFSTNPRHNPPVALAAETLTARLRERTNTIHGLWSVAEGFKTETFSLNDLYPLVRAWCIVDPPVAIELVKTALSLQQSSGGFPSWIDSDGLVSPVAPWPFIARSFELAWQKSEDPMLLKKHLPALRKYVQWALRRFDPHRQRIPSWQSEQEVFIPESFDRDKATPELTVFLITELEAVLRLCEANDHAETAAESLVEERNQLAQALNTAFWNPVEKAFSNVWKNGRSVNEPSFGSFIPLLWRGLDREKQTALLENFEESHGFPGHRDSSSWEQEDIADTAHRPAIHQFMAFDAVRSADSSRRLLMLFVRRAREGFTAWFERESLEAVRGKASGESAYALGPVTAALVLTVQTEFEHEAAKSPSVNQLIAQWTHQLKIRKFEVYFVLGVLVTMLLVHLLYGLPHSRHNEITGLVEATLNYQQGRYAEAMRICRRYPNQAVSQFIQANLLMLAEQPGKAKDLYLQALTQEPESPSALFGLAIALQMNGDFKQAEKRYVDFMDIYETRFPDASLIADEFRLLSQEEFRRPPRWRRIFELPLMNDLGL